MCKILTASRASTASRTSLTAQEARRLRRVATRHQNHLEATRSGLVAPCRKAKRMTSMYRHRMLRTAALGPARSMPSHPLPTDHHRTWRQLKTMVLVAHPHTKLVTTRLATRTSRPPPLKKDSKASKERALPPTPLLEAAIDWRQTL